MKNSKVSDLEKKKSQLEERIKSEKRKTREKERKLDTRKKIIIGAITIKLIEEHDSFKIFFITQGLDKHASERDRKIVGY